MFVAGLLKLSNLSGFVNIWLGNFPRRVRKDYSRPASLIDKKLFFFLANQRQAIQTFLELVR